MADAQDLKSCGGDPVPVRVRSSAVKLKFVEAIEPLLRNAERVGCVKEVLLCLRCVYSQDFKSDEDLLAPNLFLFKENTG